METVAERDSRKRWAWASAGGAITLWFIDGIIMCNANGFAFWTKPLQAALWMAVLPNVVAGLGAVSLAYALLRETDRDHYVKAMRKVRRAIHQLRSGPDPVLGPDHAQAMMEKIVPAISDLYYKQGEPPTTSADKAREKDSCLLCPSIAKTMNGRCDKCKDIPPSWSVEPMSD